MKKQAQTETSKNLRRSSTSSDSKTLKTLFENMLKSTYSVEQQLIEALPEMAKAAYNEQLEDAIKEHLEQTKRQAERLEKIFDRLNMEHEAETCHIMKTLIEAGKETLTEYEEGPVRDAAIIIGAQKIEHHEIAIYGSLCELAEVLGYHKIADILDRTLLEEEDADQRLTDIAMDVNDEAYEMADEMSESL